MNNGLVKSTLILVVAVFVNWIVCLESRGQVSIDCDVQFQTGDSTAKLLGMFELMASSPIGFLDARFSNSPLKSIRMSSLDSLIYLGGSALFSGPAVVVFQNGNKRQRIQTIVSGYAEDIDSQHPDFPDSMLIFVQTSSGVFGVSGTVRAGDISVVDQ
jgi:hypothetical protein